MGRNNTNNRTINRDRHFIRLTGIKKAQGRLRKIAEENIGDKLSPTEAKKAWKDVEPKAKEGIAFSKDLKDRMINKKTDFINKTPFKSKSIDDKKEIEQQLNDVADEQPVR